MIFNDGDLHLMYELAADGIQLHIYEGDGDDTLPVSGGGLAVKVIQTEKKHYESRKVANLLSTHSYTKWSHWLMLPYLVNGEFPCLTCCSFISSVMGWGNIPTPKELLQYLYNESLGG
jgi:hypothetical protein